MSDFESHRESALDRLAAGFADGRLAESDYEQARRAVAAAQTPTAIERVLREHRIGSGSGTGEAVPAEPAHSVTAILGERQAGGEVLRHRYVAATAVMGSLKLDLRDAVVQRDVRIHLVSVMAEVEILLPQGIRVRSTLTPLLAEHRDESRSSGDADAPCIEFTGTAILSEVRIR